VVETGMPLAEVPADTADPALAAAAAVAVPAWDLAAGASVAVVVAEVADGEDSKPDCGNRTPRSFE